MQEEYNYDFSAPPPPPPQPLVQIELVSATVEVHAAPNGISEVVNENHSEQVVDLTIDTVEFVALVGKDAKEGTATCTGPAKHDCGVYEYTNCADRCEAGYVRSISPGQTTPSNTEIISRSCGWMASRIFSAMTTGLTSDPKLSWSAAVAPTPTTRRSRNATPSVRSLI